MKRTIIISLFAMLIASIASGQELSKQALVVQQISQKATDNYLMKHIYPSIKQGASEKWSGDYQMQVYHINQQSEAYLKVMGYFAKIGEQEKEVASILISSLTKWGVKFEPEGDHQRINPYGADWTMVVYEYENQMEAYKKLKGGRP